MSIHSNFVTDLILAARNDSRNEDKPDGTNTVGFSDLDVARYLNYASESIQSLIIKAKSGAFKIDTDITPVVGQESYTVPDRVYSGESIINIAYTPTGQPQDYYDLRRVGDSYRRPVSEFGFPRQYIRRSKSFYINPLPGQASGNIRVTYHRQLDDLCPPVATVSGTPSGSTITYTGAATWATSYLVVNRFICITSAQGTVLLRNAPIASLGSGNFTVTGNVADYLLTGYALSDLANGYITIGQYSTTHTILQSLAWKYLVEYAVVHCFLRDSSEDYNKALGMLSDLGKEIVALYQDINQDEQFIQIENKDLVIKQGRGLW